MKLSPESLVGLCKKMLKIFKLKNFPAKTTLIYNTYMFKDIMNMGYDSAKKYIEVNTKATPDKYKSGGTHELYSVTECEDVIVKRIRPDAEMVRRCDGDLTKAIQRLKREHEEVASYLPGFVPRTAYMEADFGHGNEWFMLQERASGEEFWMLKMNPDEHKTSISENFKRVYIDFCERYKRMRGRGKVLEDQIMLDFKNDRIWVFDTNTLKDRSSMLDTPIIFDLLKDKPQSADAKDVWSFLQRNFRAANLLDINNQIDFLDNICIPGKTYLAIIDELCKLQHVVNLDFDVLLEVQRLCGGLSYFPPSDFEDNIFTLELKRTLKSIDNNFKI